MSEQPIALPPEVRTDLPGWVKFFSVLLILAGAACVALFLFLITVLLLLEPGNAMETRTVIPSSLIYLALGVAFVALGIGSWKLRRWSRPLILTIGWSWLIAGALGVLVLAVMLPGLLEPYKTSETASAFGCVVAMTVAVLLLLLLVPTGLVVFYSRPSVRALFDRDPRTYWTDRTHPVLLGIAVLMWVGAFASLAALAYPALPMFGRMLTGWPLRLAVIAIAALCAWIGWAVYRRQPAGFWGLVALQVLSLVNLITMRGLDEAAMFRGMGYSEEEVAQTARLDMFRDPLFLGVMAFSWLLLTVALFAIRKHFVPAGAARTTAPPPV
jgi:hypothetical protein